jgi:hypothetical protein
MSTENAPTPDPQSVGAPAAPHPARLPYEPPALEPLGPWSVLTVQQSVPITP